MNDVRMEWTNGLGKAAEVWVDGQLLNVCDNISTAQCRHAPGVLENVAFSYVTDVNASWADSIAANVGGRRRLECVRGWAYIGAGKIISVMPVVIDFGILQMPDPRWSTDNNLIGRHVEVYIDRLELRPAHDSETE